MSAFDRLRAIQVSSTTAVWCIGALVCISGGVIYTVQQRLGGSTPERASVSQVAPPTHHAPATTEDETVSVPDTETAPISTMGNSYAVISERNLFQPLNKPQNKQAASVSSASIAGNVTLPPDVPRQVPPQPIRQAPRSTPTPPDPSKSIAFTGVVTTPDGMSALLENIATKETLYVTVSDFAFGFQVEQITPSSVTLYQDGSSATLMLGGNKPDEQPATAGAPQGGANAAQPGNGAANNATPAERPGATGRISRMNLTPEQMEQGRASRFNRSNR